MKWMRERKLKTMAVFIGSFSCCFYFTVLCFLGAVLGSVCYVRYRIKSSKGAGEVAVDGGI